MSQSTELSDSDLLRYSRTIFLENVDYAGQLKLNQSKVWIVGVGGLGSPVALYLAASGVGEIYLSDDDEVEISNLARQIIHTEADIGKAKTISAKEKLIQINSNIKVHTLTKTTAELLERNLSKVDLILDCSDNFETRFLVNRHAKKAKVPLVSGAALRFEGQVMSFLNTPTSPCYQCLYPNLSGGGVPENCVDCGVFPPLVGLVGSIQATEAIKILINLGVSLENRMLMVSSFDMKFKEIKLFQDKNCLICYPKS